MKITNKKNLPETFVTLATEGRHEHTPGRYSATTLLNPVKQTILFRRYDDKIEEDVADMIWLIWGTAVHNIMEAHDKTGLAEIKMEHPLGNGIVISGKCDLYDAENSSVVDYKTGTVWKVLYQDFDDWRLQGLIYAWLLRASGRYVDKMRFIVLLKDWSAREARLRADKDEFYPDAPVWTWEYSIQTHDIQEIDEYIKAKAAQLKNAESLPDECLPLCTPEERWNTGDKWAVKKGNNKRALRVFDESEKAHEFIEDRTDCHDLKIEHRPGEDRRCDDYCLVNRFCSYYVKKGGK